MTESLYGVREVEPPGQGEADRLRIFFPHALAQRTTQWERGDDPLTRFSFTGDYDEYGQPRTQLNIAVPRGRDFNRTLPAAAPHPEPYLATYTRTDYAQPIAAGTYLFNRVARATTYEVTDERERSVWALQSAIEAGQLNNQLTVIAQTLSFYDGPAFQGLAFGVIGEYGAVMRTETLVLTENILQDAYRSGANSLNPAEIPPYMSPNNPPAWTADYPQGFRQLLPAAAGYIYQAGGANSEYERGYFAVTSRQSYDFQDAPAVSARGLLKVRRDPLGRDTTISYEQYDLLPMEITDPVHLSTRVLYDYRVLQPSGSTDPNENRLRYSFTPLGLLKSITVMGKVGENVGDTDAIPGTRFEYDFTFSMLPRPNPISVRTILRVHHAHDNDVPLPERDETLVTIEYSDGFGRQIQTRTLAENLIFEDPALGRPLFGDAGLPADQTRPGGEAVGRQSAQGLSWVTVSGWQTYNNKGRVVEKYEPFFSSGWDYAPPSDFEMGQKATLHYDPRGQTIHTVNPDGSEQRIVYGVPPDLTDPEQFTPTPWEIYTYDNNDNAGRTHPGDSLDYQHHWNTPISVVVDALGRTVLSTERNRRRLSSGFPSPLEEYRTRSAYDIRGNLLAVTDALQRMSIQYVYDLANNPLRIENSDAGVRRTILDAAGNEIERRSSKGAVVLQAYDMLNRPLRLWARDDADAGSLITLRERLEYGDGSDPTQPVNERSASRIANRLTRLYRHYDEAGLLTFEAYNFKGHVLEKSRLVISDATILAVFNLPLGNGVVPAYRADWQPPAGTTLEDHANNLLDARVYQTSTTYDALNRIRLLRYPQDEDGERKTLRPLYNRAGALEQVELNGATYVARVAYNAKGQRTLIAYNNGLMTRYAYDPRTFRLARMRTERYSNPTPSVYRPDGGVLQDFAYTYDLAGNIRLIQDRSPGSGIPNTVLRTDALDRFFSYDALYRLTSATGRECDTPPPDPMWSASFNCHDVTLTRAYTEAYSYDPLGNIIRLRHLAGQGNFTRDFSFVPGTNRLETLTIGANDFAYTYDESGNLIQENAERHFEWDHSNRMRVYRTQIGAAPPSVHAHYLYDGGGQRVKKYVRMQYGQRIRVTVYIDGIFEHHRVIEGGAPQDNNSLHILDDQQRIAILRVGNPLDPNDTTPAVQYHLSDHLGSSNLVVNRTAAWINREEYTPYGETSFGSFARKRYRFTGKERDEENGLYYHGARYYAPWLGRWTSADPAGAAESLNLYQYVVSNPLRLVDSSGYQSEPQPTQKEQPPPNVSGTTEQKGAKDPAAPDQVKTSTTSKSKTNTLPTVPELYKTRPDLFYPDSDIVKDLVKQYEDLNFNTRVILDADVEDSQFDPIENVITLKKATIEKTQSSLIHELAHGLQHKDIVLLPGKEVRGAAIVSEAVKLGKEAYVERSLKREKEAQLTAIRARMQSAGDWYWSQEGPEGQPQLALDEWFQFREAFYAKKAETEFNEIQEVAERYQRQLERFNDEHFGGKRVLHQPPRNLPPF